MAGPRTFNPALVKGKRVRFPSTAPASGLRVSMHYMSSPPYASDLSDEGYPEVGDLFMVVDHEGNEQVYEVTSVVQGGRPEAVETIPGTPGILRGTGFGAAQSWRNWRSMAVPVEVSR